VLGAYRIGALGAARLTATATAMGTGTATDGDGAVAVVLLALLALLALKMLDLLRRQLLYWVGLGLRLAMWLAVASVALYVWQRGLEASVRDFVAVGALVAGAAEGGVGAGGSGGRGRERRAQGQGQGWAEGWR
jgi:hypothetical protein